MMSRRVDIGAHRLLTDREAPWPFARGSTVSRCGSAARVDVAGPSFDHGPEPVTYPERPVTPNSPPGPLVTEVARLRLEVAELRSLLTAPKKDGAGMLTATALLELQSEVVRLRESVNAIDPTSRLDALEGHVTELAQSFLELAEGLRSLLEVDASSELEAVLLDAFGEQQERLVTAIEALGTNMAALRASLLGG
jgi:hypothetical protein